MNVDSPIYVLDSSDDESMHASGSRLKVVQGRGRQFLRRQRSITPLYRCRFTAGDERFCEPYALQRDGELDEHHRLTYSCEASHFYVDRSVIYIGTRDIILGANAPKSRTTVKNGRHTIHSQVVVLSKHDPTQQAWLRKVGAHIAKIMFDKLPKNKDNRPFELGNFPAGMLLIRRVKTHSDRVGHRRSDAYLTSDSNMTFRSPAEFARHAMWLMDGRPHNACLCKYCVHSRQKPITEDLIALAGRSQTEMKLSSLKANVEVIEILDSDEE